MDHRNEWEIEIFEIHREFIALKEGERIKAKSHEALIAFVFTQQLKLLKIKIIKSQFANQIMHLLQLYQLCHENQPFA